MFTLQGTVIKEELDEIIDSKITLYPFSIYFGIKFQTFYTIKKEDRAKWVKSIRKDTGCFNVNDLSLIHI